MSFRQFGIYEALSLKKEICPSLKKIFNVYLDKLSGDTYVAGACSLHFQPVGGTIDLVLPLTSVRA